MSVAADLRRLGGQTLVYGLGTILLRAASFLMLPVYTRFLTRDDYGIVGLATSVMGVLAIMFPLGLHGAMGRLYTDAREEERRREVLGTLWLGAAVAAGLLALATELAGARWGDVLSRQVPYDPYVRWAVWAAFAQVLPLVVAAYLQMSERPGAYVLVTSAPALLSIAGIVVEVVIRRQGAEGYLRGTLAGTALGALPALWMTLRHARWRFRGELLKRGLAFSLPLVLQAGAGWLLVISDRVILERYLPLAQVGLYTVAFQVAAVITVAAQAMNSAWSPYLFRKDEEEGPAARERLARLATYFCAAIAWGALGVALGGRDILRLMAGPAFQEGHAVLPWLALSGALGAAYLVPAGLLFVRARTGWICVTTALSGLAAAGLNLALVPRFGFVAAGWSAVAGQLLHLALVAGLASRVFPLPYEGGRLLRIAAAGAALYALGRLLPAEPWGATAAGRAAVWAAFPLALAITGFLTPGERARLRPSSREAASGPR